MNYEDLLARRPRWQRLERELDLLEDHLQRRRRSVDDGALSYDALEEVILHYRRTLSDFALARARFPDTWAALHLSALVNRANRTLGSRVRQGSGGIVGFYRSTFPGAFRAISTELAICVSLFALAVLLGVGLAAGSPTAAHTFLPEEAIEGLSRGEMWTDEIEGRNSFFSAAIASNNMKVAITAWVGGLLAGVGSLFVVFFNGLMLGVVFTTLFHYSAEAQLAEFIAAHGPLELSLILVAGAAGLHLGRSLLEEDDRPRATRLSEAAMRSVVVVVGCLPWFLILGFVEGFVSPAPQLPSALKLTVGIALEVLFLLVVWRPRPIGAKEAFSGRGTASRPAAEGADG